MDTEINTAWWLAAFCLNRASDHVLHLFVSALYLGVILFYRWSKFVKIFQLLNLKKYPQLSSFLTEMKQKKKFISENRRLNSEIKTKFDHRFFIKTKSQIIDLFISTQIELQSKWFTIEMHCSYNSMVKLYKIYT